MRDIIGDPQIFALEYSIDTLLGYYPFGGCRLWIEGNFLGDIDDPCILPSTKIFLTCILSPNTYFELEDHILELSDLEIFELMRTEEIEDHNYLLNVEGFHAFYSYLYRKDDFFHFLWMFIPELEEIEEYQNFPKDFYSGKVAISVYEEVMLEFRRILAIASPELGLPLRYHLRLKIWP